MRHEQIYDHKLVKGDLIEIYAKNIANLGIFNILTEKTMDWHTTGDAQGGGMCGECLCGYTRGLHAYIARQIMDSDGDVKMARMERGRLLYEHPSRKISLRYSNDQTHVELEGSPRAIQKMRRTIDEMFIASPEELAQNERMVAFLQEPNLYWINSIKYFG